MIIPRNINRRLLSTYRESSIDTFTTNLKHILENIYNIHTLKYTLKPLKNDPNKFMNYINNNTSPQQLPDSTKKNLTAAALAFLKADLRTPENVLTIYQKFFDTIAKSVDDAKLYKAPSISEEEAFIPWKDIIAKFKKYENIVKKFPDQNFAAYEDKYIYLKYLLLALYTTIPPLRGEEYRNAIIIRVKNPKNYDIITSACNCNLADIENNNFVVPFYKTSKTHDTRIIPIPNTTSEIITKWYKITNGNKYLLPNLQTPSTNMSQSALTHLIQRIFSPHKISTSMLRKIYISNKLKTIYNKPQERKKLAKLMGHTLQLQEFIYNKFK